MLWLKDRALRQYHFSKYSDEGVADLLRPAGPLTGEQAQRQRAFAKFNAHYGLDGIGLDPEAAREFLVALKAGRVPAWGLNLVPLGDVQDAARR